MSFIHNDYMDPTNPYAGGGSDQIIRQLSGRIARGTALAIKMRAALYWGDLDLAMSAARSIKKLSLYENAGRNTYERNIIPYGRYREYK